MELPLDITIRDIDNTEAIDAKIRSKAKKLQQFYDRITFCKVVVEETQKHKHQGKEYQVKFELGVPGEILVVNHQSHRNVDLYVAIRDSFNAMKRQLQEYAQKQRGDKKNHNQQLTGKVVRLFPDYGFIETSDGNEYYFHEANVMQIEFSKLIVGTTVHFFENTAGDSLQAYQVTCS